MKKLGATVSVSSGYWRQSNTQVERTNQELGRFLRSHCRDWHEEWAQFLPLVKYAQNSLRRRANSLPVRLQARPWPAVDIWFRQAEEVWNSTHVRLQGAVRLQKDQSDLHRSEAPVYRPGDRVWLSTRNLTHCPKLRPWFVGHFKVLRSVNYQISPSFHVFLLWPVVSGPLTDVVPCDTPPPPLDIEWTCAC